MNAMAFYDGAFGFEKDRKLRKAYRDKGCSIAYDQRKFDTIALKLACGKERVRLSKDLRS